MALQRVDTRLNIYAIYIFMEPSMLAPAAKLAAGCALDDVAFTLIALLRADGHVCNVLTHISLGDWRAIEEAILTILEPRGLSKKFSKTTRNILELLCDDLGTTGRIMRPSFFEAIAQIAGKAEMKRVEARTRRLRQRMSFDPPARPVRWTSRQASPRERSYREASFPARPLIIALPQPPNGVGL